MKTKKVLFLLSLCLSTCSTPLWAMENEDDEIVLAMVASLEDQNANRDNEDDRLMAALAASLKDQGTNSKELAKVLEESRYQAELEEALRLSMPKNSQTTVSSLKDLCIWKSIGSLEEATKNLEKISTSGIPSELKEEIASGPEELIKEIIASPFSKQTKEKLFQIAKNQKCQIDQEEYEGLFDFAQTEDYRYIVHLLLENWIHYNNDYGICLIRAAKYNNLKAVQSVLPFKYPMKYAIAALKWAQAHYNTEIINLLLEKVEFAPEIRSNVEMLKSSVEMLNKITQQEHFKDIESIVVRQTDVDDLDEQTCHSCFQAVENALGSVSERAVKFFGSLTENLFGLITIRRSTLADHISHHSSINGLPSWAKRKWKFLYAIEVMDLEPNEKEILFQISKGNKVDISEPVLGMALIVSCTSAQYGNEDTLKIMKRNMMGIEPSLLLVALADNQPQTLKTLLKKSSCSYAELQGVKLAAKLRGKTRCAKLLEKKIASLSESDIAAQKREIYDSILGGVQYVARKALWLCFLYETYSAFMG